MTATCSFPACTRPCYLKGLCMAHCWQARRGQELRPLQERSRVPLVPVWVRVLPWAAKIVSANKQTARAILEGWAESKRIDEEDKP